MVLIWENALTIGFLRKSDLLKTEELMKQIQGKNDNQLPRSSKNDLGFAYGKLNRLQEQKPYLYASCINFESLLLTQKMFLRCRCYSKILLD